MLENNKKDIKEENKEKISQLFYKTKETEFKEIESLFSSSFSI